MLKRKSGQGRIQDAESAPLFEISFPETVRRLPVTGRMLLILSRHNDPEVRLQVNSLTSPPLFGLDVHGLLPGEVAVIDNEATGYPIETIAEIPAGFYYAQAILNVYTEFHRSDGHVIWAHLDQWEGQRAALSPGNLYSKVSQVYLDGLRSDKVTLELTETIPPVAIPADTEWVKHVKIQSEILTQFWGRPIYLGAVVLLPRGYSRQPDAHYPIVYTHGHFSLNAPFDFSTDELLESEDDRAWRERCGAETGYEFYQSWISDGFPRVIAVSLLHPTPYYDSSYAVNSANNGPYGDAIMTELIPYIEARFRVIRQPRSRMLTGASTGGWVSLALQLQHPDFFGGAWAFCPDPIDFRRYGPINIYEDDNAFAFDSSQGVPKWFRQDWSRPQRFFVQSDDGQPLFTVRGLSRLETILGTRGRSGAFLENWEVVYGPVGEDGYPRPLWDRQSGEIDRCVAEYMRDRGYDLCQYARENWGKLGPRLAGKLHIYCGEMDNFYLNLGVYLFDEFLQKSDPSHGGEIVVYGRPMKGHGWQPMTNAALIRTIAAACARVDSYSTFTERNSNAEPKQ